MPTTFSTMLFALTLKEGPWCIRIDGPHSAEGQRHIHLTRSRLRGEYSWNVDGSRHDEHRFPESGKALKAAKRVAAAHLNVPESRLALLSAERLIAPSAITITALTDGGEHPPAVVVLQLEVPAPDGELVLTIVVDSSASSAVVVACPADEA